MDWQSFFGYELMGNQMQNYTLSLISFVFILILLRLFKYIVLGRLKAWSARTKNSLDDLLIDMMSCFGWPFYLILSAYISLVWIHLPGESGKYLFWAMLVIFAFYAVRALMRLIDYVAVRLERKHDGENEAIIGFLAGLVKGFLWFLILLLVLSNMGVNITSLVAGLGVVGIAVAFAVQNILEDLFSSVSIYFDKPFRKGDFIILADGKYMGTVKHIGMKTTRLESLWGEEIVISNRELTSSKVSNYKRMSKRRIVFRFGVVYSTTSKKMEKIPSMVKEIFSKIKLAKLDRVHFKSFGDSSLDYEVMYSVDSDDYNVYMDVQQQINLALKKAFEREKIDFAYPTTTVYLRR